MVRFALQNGSGRRRKIFKADSVEAHGDCEDCQPKTSTNYNLRQQRLSQAHPSVQTGSSDAGQYACRGISPYFGASSTEVNFISITTI